MCFVMKLTRLLKFFNAKILCHNYSFPNIFKYSTLEHFKRAESKLITMKVETPQFRAIFTPEINMLLELFKKYGYGLRMAGGAVRDILMEKNPEDIDFATTATPEQMINMFNTEGIRMFNHKGETHGTVTVRINDQQNFEITTLRVDMRTDGRHAEVEFTTDWELDAGRRDLTVNAMFLGFDGTLHDYFNGRKDLEERIIKFVGDPSCRIQEDYLRILRYFRFYGRIAVEANNHDSKTLEAIRNNAGGLKQIAGERMWMEFKKILAGNYAKELVLLMIDLGIGTFIGIPSHPNIKEYEMVCDRCKTMKPHSMTLLTALLKNEDDLLAIHSRLKFSRYEKDLASFILNNKEDKNGDPPLKPYLHLILNSQRKQSDICEWACEVLKYRGESLLWKELSEMAIPKFPVNGFLLLDRGYVKGPELNKRLSQLKSKWIESNFTLTREELLDSIDKIQEN